MAMIVNVRFNSTQNIPIQLNQELSVSGLKKIISSKINIPASEMRIIFAGTELKDHMTLEMYNLATYSILHVIAKQKLVLPVDVKATKSSLYESLQKIQMPSDLKDDDSLQKTLGGIKNHFFVYCKFHCKDICPGKLRVQCSTCKQGAFTVLQEPSCWDDILLSNRIQGLCHTEGCNGKTAEFCFRCASHSNSINMETDSCVVLNLIKPNYRMLPCIVCYDVCSPVIVFDCIEQHLLCLDCFRTYCFTMLNERRFIQHSNVGYTLPCPNGCENSLIQEIHHFRILGDEQYDRYQRYGAEECLLQTGGVLCPRPGCGAGILPDREARRVECIQGGCGFIFCRNCMEEFHPGECMQRKSTFDYNLGLPIDYFLAREARAELQSFQTIQKTTKPCPKCKVPTEKDGGCMHIVCIQSQCGLQWCWLCEQAWSRDCQGNHWFG